MPLSIARDAGLKGTADQIADRLRAAIEDGSLAPGDALNQVDLAASFGLSRIPIREALRRLEAEGYVTYRPNKGAAVAPSASADDIEEIVDARECLELLLMRHAVPRMSGDVLANATVALRALNRARTPAELTGAHERFHTALFDAARRPRTAALINGWRFRLDQSTDPDGARRRAYARGTSGVHKRSPRRVRAPRCEGRPTLRARRVRLHPLDRSAPSSHRHSDRPGEEGAIARARQLGFPTSGETRMPFQQVWDDKAHLFGGEAVYAHFFVFVDWDQVDANLANAFQFAVSVRVAGIQFWATQQVALAAGPVQATLDPKVAAIATGQLPRAIAGEIDDWSGVDGSGDASWTAATSVRFLVAGKADVTLPVAALAALVGRLGGAAGSLIGFAAGLFGSKVRVTIGHSNVAIPVHRDANGRITQINALARA